MVEKRHLTGVANCAEAAPTTKTVQKIKKNSFICKISVVLCVNYEKIGFRDYKNASKLPAADTRVKRKTRISEKWL
jgi:hypothetical protein